MAPKELLLFEISRDGLHRRLGGGVPKGSIVMIAGEFGAGKSALAQRLTYGFLSNRHSVTYVSTELTTKGFIDQMASLDYSVTDNIVKRRDLRFVPVYPIIGRTLERKDFLSRLMASEQLFKTEVTVIDTFSALVKDELTEEKCPEVLSFFKKVVTSGKSVILTVDPQEVPSAVLTPFRSVSEVCVNLSKSHLEGELHRTITVDRYSLAQDYVGSVIGFRVEHNRGIIVDITTVA